MEYRRERERFWEVPETEVYGFGILSGLGR